MILQVVDVSASLTPIMIEMDLPPTRGISSGERDQAHITLAANGSEHERPLQLDTSLQPTPKQNGL